MKRKHPTRSPLAALALLLVLHTTACSQPVAVDHSVDSLRVADAEWRVDSLDGFTLRRYHFGQGGLFCSAQYLCLIEIAPDSPRRLAFVHDERLAAVSQLASRLGALAAVNGSFFDMGQFNPICYLRIGGRQVGENTPQKSDTVNRKYYQYATLVLDSAGRPHLRVPDSNRHAEAAWPDSNIMTAGPMLLADGRTLPQRDDRTFVTARHNRTALGLKPDGTVLLLVADGHFRHRADGLSLPELALIMRWLGCSDAINLDGGGSSTMFVRDLPDDGVANHPSDNNAFDHLGQRPVSNAIVVL